MDGYSHAGGNPYNKLKYSGKELDEEQGLYKYHGAGPERRRRGWRDYYPEPGRWVVVDPARQFASGYVYGGNNPFIGYDEDGRFFWTVVIIGSVINTIMNANDINNVGDFFKHASIGALGGAMGYGAGLLAPVGILPGMAYGAGSGGLIGGITAKLSGNKFADGFKAGAIGGGLFGAYGGYQMANDVGANIWTGDYTFDKHFNKIQGLGWRSTEEINIPANKVSENSLAYAEKQYSEGSERWTKEANPQGQWKCNKFCGDVYTEGGGIPRSVDGVKGYPTYPKSNLYARANDMASVSYNPKKFQIISLSKANAGDIIIFPQSGSSGHMGIMGIDKTFISARQFTITSENLFWTRMKYLIMGRDIVVRRYAP